jgi:hypothetical protein
MRARIGFRERRRERLTGPHAPEYLVLLDESVLSRNPGGAAVMTDQLHLLQTLADAKKIRVRIIPRSGSLIYQIGPFVLADLEPGKSALLYREIVGGDETVDDPSAVDAHRARFDQMWDLALDETKSKVMIARYIGPSTAS